MKKLAIIGAGPGGYVTAIKAAKLGFDVSIIEKGPLGGTCLNEGCIPSKFLAKSSSLMLSTSSFDYYGIDGKDFSVNLKKLNKRKNLTIKKLGTGIKYLLEKNKVKVINGEAKFVDDSTIKVNDESVKFDYCIIATGSKFVSDLDSKKLITTTKALELKEIPKSVTIIGANSVGVEFAYIYKGLGSKVLLIDEESLVGEFGDKEVSKVVGDVLEKLKIKIDFIKDIDVEKIESDVILDVRNRKGNIESLNLDSVGIKSDKTFIKTNNNFETSVKNIFAIGDVNGKEFWAHSASQQGVHALDVISGKKASYKENNNPKCMYIDPQVAVVGMTESEAERSNIDYEVGKFPLGSNGMSMILKEDKGFIKVIVGKKYKEVLGCVIVSKGASELINMATLAIRLEATVDEMVDMVYSHPSVVEGMKEAFGDVDNMAIHI